MKATAALASVNTKCQAKPGRDLDTIFIRGLTVRARHGAMPHEAEIGQRFSVDLDISADLSKSSTTDRLSDTICYGEVVAVTIKAFTSVRRSLLERAASDVINALFAGFARIAAVRLTIRKSDPLTSAIVDSVGVSLFVERSNFGDLGNVRNESDQ